MEWLKSNNSLDGQQPNRNQEQNVVFKKLAGDVRQSSLKILTATISKVALKSIGLILVQEEELTWL